MNVIVSVPKLNIAEHQSPSAIQMDCLLIGAEVSFRMAHSQSALGAFRSTWPIQDALFGGLGGLRCTDGFNAAYKSVFNPADALVENGIPNVTPT